MNEEVDRINQVLPDTLGFNTEKTVEIQEWIERILQRMEHYKAEHYALLKEAISLLELALWKANLIKNDGEEGEEKQPAKRAKIIDECGDTSAKAVDAGEEASYNDDARRAARVTCGADIIIKNVLPFLNDNDEFPTVDYDLIH